MTTKTRVGETVIGAIVEGFPKGELDVGVATLLNALAGTLRRAEDGLHDERIAAVLERAVLDVRAPDPAKLPAAERGAS